MNGTTAIVLTFTDCISAENRDARRYEQLTAETIRSSALSKRSNGWPASQSACSRPASVSVASSTVVAGSPAATVAGAVGTIVA